ncbi:MAG TPA: pentapeptide repeat-containing protein [Mycobacteriales bacterium]|nr:pentapeptide repeat-containing protein [Mycobacteriales bacterium]
MADSEWSVAAPADTRTIRAWPEIDDDEPLDLRGVAARGRRISGVELSAHSELVDLVATDCDISGLLAQQSRLERAELVRSRLRGVTWAGGVVRDVLLDEVRTEDASVRFSALRRVIVRDSDLPGLDLTECTLEQVRFEQCTLRGARFDHATMVQVGFTGCDLTGVSGAAAFAGASMQLDDLLSLAPSLARELGITII